MKTRNRHIVVAEELYEDLAPDGGSGNEPVRIPPLRELTETYRASFGTIRRAILWLVEEGKCVKKGPRAFFLIRGDEPVSEELVQKDTAAVQLADRIRADILSGRYETGTQLPKTRYFALTFSVSSHTVSCALKRVGAEGLVRKQGSKWIVGNPAHTAADRVSDTVQQSYQSNRPTVVVVVRNPNHYANMSTNDFSQPFFDTAFRELSLNGFKVAVCFTEHINPLYRCVSGLSDIVDFVGATPAYAGALLLGSENAYEPALIGDLVSFAEPVVWFDFFDQSLKRQYTYLHRERNFVTCRLNMREITRAAVRFLYECGHRRIGVPDPSPLAGNALQRWWLKKRVEDIQAEAGSCSPPLECFVVKQHESFFAQVGDHGKYSELWKPAAGIALPPDLERGTARAARAREPTLNDVPSLKRLIREHRVSALCACNDFFARDYFYWLGRVGIAVPEDISIISFDNSCAALPLGLTSVDFGLSHLAHQAAGVLMNRIPRPSGKPPTLWSKPWLIKRDSVGRI